ncbi:hypothetical protein DEV92_105104 [Phyllobacterium myrsinacearum]|nr:hypothetical protein DEV92_105104 [Phyllobacterium myrsinacearum]RZS77405.1 hypothetical protein EV217_4767 [Phyllobacterium myrsinacearum]
MTSWLLFGEYLRSYVKRHFQANGNSGHILQNDLALER